MYSTTFQCPETGQMVRARYALGKIAMEALDSEWVADGTLPPEINEQTIAWCRRHSGHRFRSLQEAEQYLLRAAGDQTFGFERD